MNLQDYIDSGILELYASGLLTEQEMQEVDRIVARYPELEKELDQIFASLESMHLKTGKGPSKDLLTKINQSILSEVSTTTESKTEAKVVEMNPAKSKKTYLLPFAATFALLIASTVSLFIVWQDLQSTKSQLVALQSENDLFANNFTTLKTESVKSEKMLVNYRDTSFVKIQLKGLALSPQSNAIVFWDKKSQVVMLDLIDMPATDAEHEYQLWALDNGKPVDAGVFDSKSGSPSFVQLNKITSAHGFAVTIEPNGGSVNPTMDKMVLYSAI